MVSDGEYGIRTSRFREFSDEVNGNCFERKGVLQVDRVEGGLILYVFTLSAWH